MGRGLSVGQDLVILTYLPTLPCPILRFLTGKNAVPIQDLDVILASPHGTAFWFLNVQFHRVICDESHMTVMSCLCIDFISVAHPELPPCPTPERSRTRTHTQTNPPSLPAARRRLRNETLVRHWVTVHVLDERP